MMPKGLKPPECPSLRAQPYDYLWSKWQIIQGDFNNLQDYHDCQTQCCKEESWQRRGEETVAKSQLLMIEQGIPVDQKEEVD
jgi:hypothetical protein